MSTEAQREEKLSHASIWDSPLGQVVQATEEQRRLYKAQAEAAELETQMNLAKVLSKAGVFGDQEDEYKAFAKIQIGAELGLKPAESMRAVFFGQGGPDIDTNTRVQLALRTGRYRYDILVLDSNRCEIQWYRKAGQIWEPLPIIKASVDQIKHITIWEKGKQVSLADKWNYKSWREDMLYWFVQRRAIKRYAPETQGSFAMATADDEAMEDAGIYEGTPLTHAEAQQTINDLFGDAGMSPKEELERDMAALEAHESAPETNGTQDDVPTVSDEKATDGDSGAFKGYDPQTGEVIESDAELAEVGAMEHGVLRQNLLGLIREVATLPEDAPGSKLTERTGALRVARARLKSPTKGHDDLSECVVTLTKMLADATF